ncbi:carbon monoxide dehydrogenase subunit G [Pseudonocardia sp.]|uniref:SRPBCC family protein n=1 Tax=Pseudonocardia sp. TaxID=60912 RepID=UPI00261D42B5|nr:carbon monoxide dehydrogenase subunit G [Pseudonocardia sp.]
MDMSGEIRIPAPREVVWKALNDPDVLKASIPGCETLERTADDAFSAKVKAAVGPVKATFTGDVKLTDINPPESYTISGEGKGGAAGFAKGGAEVKLTEDGDETVLSYEVKATVGGKLAQIGSRLIDSTARKMADKFFANFTEQVAPKLGEAADKPPRTAAEAAIDESAGPASTGLPAIVWIPGVLAVVVVLLLIFGLG